MSAVTMPWGRALEYEDLSAIPDDGHRYELVDGVLLVTPSPGLHHQLAVKRLLRLIDDACPSDLVALAAPFDVVLTSRTVFEPDVLLARRADFTSRNLPAAPVLAIEVLSPSSRSIDRVLKYSRYAEAGIAHYWIVDPDEPSLTAYRLGIEGSYEELTHVTGDDPYEALEPVRVTVVPSALIAY